VAPAGGETTLLCAPAHNRINGYQNHTRSRALSLSLSLPLPLPLTLSFSSNLSFSSPSIFFSRAYARVTYLLSWPQPRDPREQNRERSLFLLPSLLFPPSRRVYAPVCVRCWAFTSRGVRTCVSTCERPVCLHARRQRHAVPHTANPSSLRSPSLASSPPWHGTSLHLHTIRYERATRQAGSAQN